MVTDASQLTCPDIQLTDNDSRADCQKVNHFEQQIQQKVLFTAQHSIKSPWVNVLSKRSLMNVIKQMSWTQTVFKIYQTIHNARLYAGLYVACRKAVTVTVPELRLDEHFQSRENDPRFWCLVITIHFVFNIDFKSCLAGRKTILNRVNVRKWLGFLYGLWSTWWGEITRIYVVVQNSLNSFFKEYFIYSFTFTTVMWALARRKTSSVPFLT